MTSAGASVDIAAPAERVWERLTDWERQGDWIPLTRVEVTGDGALGSRLSGVTGIGPAAFVDPMVIDVWEPPQRCEVAHLGRVVTGRGSFVVEPLGPQRSRCTWTEHMAGRGLRGALERAGAAPTRLLLKWSLRRLARLVESEARRAGAAAG